MRQVLAWLAVGGVLAGCTSNPGFKGVPGVREATQAEVSQCRYLMDISGEPGVYGPLLQQGLKYTRNSILADAQDAGANTVVFDPVSPGAAVYKLHATAYAC